MIAIIFILFAISTVKSQDLKIVKENRRYYVLSPDGKKVEIVKEHEGGADNVAIFSPDSKYVFYTTVNWLGFESSGKDLFYCRPNGTARTFLHKIYGYANNVSWISRDGHNYIIFLEAHAGAGEGFVDILDFDNRKMILRIKARGLERIENSECFMVKEHPGELHAGSKICLDSLLALSDPEKYNVGIYQGYVFPNFLYLSTRREAFLNPDYIWQGVPDEDAEKYHGGLGQCLPSPQKKRSVYCVNLDSKSWIGVLNSRTNLFQYSDSMTEGEYKYNLVWSDNDNYLGFVKKYPNNCQELVILEFLGDSSYTIREELKLKEKKDIEFIGWSAIKSGFEYMIGEKKLLKIQR